MADKEKEIINRNLQPTIMDLTDLSENNQQELELKKNVLKNNENDRIRRFELRKRLDSNRLSDSFQILFKNINEPVILVNDKNIITDVNPAFLKVVLYSENEIIGKKINFVLRKNRIITKNGFVDFGINKLQIGLNTLYLFTDLNEAEKSFRLIDELDALKNNLDDIVLKIKKNGKITYMNSNFKKNFPDAKEGDEIRKYIKVNKLKSKLKISENEKKVESSDGIMELKNVDQIKECPIKVKIISIKDEFILVIENQLEKLELNKQIQIAKQEYEAIVNNVTDIICIIDKKGNFKFVNKQFEKQLGYKKDSLPSLPQIIYHEDLPKLIQTLNESEKYNKIFQELEISLYTSKRKLLNFSASGISKISDGNDVKYSITLRDITEKKRSENETAKERERLKEEYKKLKEINEMKTNFVSMVSHDLKTPLTNIQGYASLLRNKILGPNTQKQQEAAEIIDKESKRLAKLINDLLDLSKMDAGVITIQKRPFNLKDLEDKCSLRHLAEKKGLTLIWNTPSNLGDVYGDPERIAQVLTNLVNNAIKFTDHGSVTINAFEKDKYNIQVDVIDTGIGIPKKEQEIIFERFQRSSSSTKNKTEGSGLGLAIAREIMRRHDSDITVKSEVGKGSIFSIVLSKAPKQVKEIGKTDKINDYIEKMTQ